MVQHPRAPTAQQRHSVRVSGHGASGSRRGPRHNSFHMQLSNSQETISPHGEERSEAARLEPWGRCHPPISGLPEIGSSGTQVGQGRLAVTPRYAWLLRMRSEKDIAPPPCFFAAPGTPSWCGVDAGLARYPATNCRPPGKEPRARGTPGSGRTYVYARVRKQGCSDPRASTPRDIEACRSPLWCPASPRSGRGSARHAASPPNPGRPARGVCEVCSAPSPVVEPFVTPARPVRGTLHR